MRRLVADVRASLRDGQVPWLCRLAILLAVVGVFGTWRARSGISLSGVEGPHDGWLVVIFGLIALAGVGSLGRGSWLGVVTVLGCSAVVLHASIGDMIDDGAAFGGQPGWGAWLTVEATVLLAACGSTVAVQQGRTRLAERGTRPPADA